MARAYPQGLEGAELGFFLLVSGTVTTRSPLQDSSAFHDVLPLVVQSCNTPSHGQMPSLESPGSFLHQQDLHHCPASVLQIR